MSIVFTNSELKKMASKKGRGFAGTLRLLIDKKDKIIAITNPLLYYKSLPYKMILIKRVQKNFYLL